MSAFVTCINCIIVKLRWSLRMIFMLVSVPVFAETKVVHNLVENANQAYSVGLIELALSYFPEKEYRIEATDEHFTQSRQIAEVESGGLSVMWAATSREMEERFTPIRVPLLRGLLGCRVFIIRDGDQHRFDGIKSISELKDIKLGQGRTWTDAQILDFAGLHVVKTNSYKSLFPMLEGGRFDAFPRGIQEPWSEVVEHKDLNLVVEKRLVLIYRMPMYFFVEKQNAELANDLEQGLLKMVDDGTFDDFFYNHPLIKDVLAKSGLKNRIPFYINNPFLTMETPIDNAKLWLDIKDL